MPRTISAILTVILGIGLIAEVRAQERSSETSIISASRGSVEGGYRLSAGNPVSVLRPDERASTFRAQSSEPQAAGGGTAYLVPAQLPAEPLPAQGEASGYVVPTQPTALPGGASVKQSSGGNWQLAGKGRVHLGICLRFRGGDKFRCCTPKRCRIFSRFSASAPAARWRRRDALEHTMRR